MLFIAIALILVGLLCFIYVSLNPNGLGGNRVSSGSRSANSENEHLISRPNSKRGADILPSSKRTPSPENLEKQKRLENLFVEGRKIPKQSFFSEPTEEQRFEGESNFEKGESIESTIDSSRLQILEESAQESLIVSRKPEEVREIRFEIDGVLYLDQNKDLPFEKLSKQKELLTPDTMKGLRRIGPGKLNESREALSFEASNSCYKYLFSEIEKILFFDEGVVLIPIKTNYPIPVFFTKETNQLKSYLESSSQTILS